MKNFLDYLWGEKTPAYLFWLFVAGIFITGGITSFFIVVMGVLSVQFLFYLINSGYWPILLILYLLICFGIPFFKYFEDRTNKQGNEK